MKVYSLNAERGIVHAMENDPCIVCDTGDGDLSIFVRRPDGKLDKYSVPLDGDVIAYGGAE